MKKQNVGIADVQVIRQKAEELMEINQVKADSTYSEGDTLKLLHELQVHQIELELINEELVSANKKIEHLAKEKYKELYDFAPSGYLTLSRDGEIVELNFVAAQLLGMERSLLINQRFDFFLSADTCLTFNLLLRDIWSGNVKKSCEVVLTSESKRPIHVNIDGAMDKTNSLCLLTLFDISKRKQAELDLLKAKKRAEESDCLKSAFLANMSHEIRTPMNGILGFAELLKNLDLESSEQQEYIRIIEMSGVRMLNIINNIVDISKIESGQMNVSLSIMDINNQLKNCFSFFEPEAKQKGIGLSFEMGLPNDEAFLKTDNDKFYGILTNLVKNAIKYTESGKIEFGYSKNNSKSELIFYVKDTGIGIPKNRQEAIFERFIQADIENKMGQEGAGLGLAISRAYVDMLEGRLWLESEEGIGSTFYFTLPYNKDGVTEIDSSDSFKDKQEVRNLKILIVEDDEVSSHLLKVMLSYFGKEILRVKNGKDAIEMCKNNPDIDLVLMDIQLPNMNGYEVTKQIREFDKKVIIIAQTAFALTGDKDKSIVAGCNDYISKPINKDELESLIQKHTNIYQKLNVVNENI